MRATDVFKFDLIDKDGDVVATGESDASGAITFTPALDFTLADVGEHTYTVTETGTPGGGITFGADQTLTILVGDNGVGELNIQQSALIFNNTYTATGSYVPVGSKTLNDGSVRPGDIFEFEFTDHNGNTVTGASNASGQITFDAPLTYTLADGGLAFDIEVAQKTCPGITGKLHVEAQPWNDKA